MSVSDPAFWAGLLTFGSLNSLISLTVQPISHLPSPIPNTPYPRFTSLLFHIHTLLSTVSSLAITADIGGAAPSCSPSSSFEATHLAGTWRLQVCVAARSNAREVRSDQRERQTNSTGEQRGFSLRHYQGEAMKYLRTGERGLRGTWVSRG